MRFLRVITPALFPAAYIAASFVFSANGHGFLWFVISLALGLVSLVWVVIYRRKRPVPKSSPRKER